MRLFLNHLKKQQDRQGENMKKNLFAVSMTVLWSAVFVTAMHDWTGICMGLCMGMAFGLFDSGEEKRKEEG